MSGDVQRRVCAGVIGVERELCPTEPEPGDSAEPADSDELESDELELDDPTIDESALPELDMEDAEAPVRETGYEDLIDSGRIERESDEGWDDERSVVEDVGLTIELDSPADDDDGAQVVDLDVGSLLTSLPSDGTELDLDASLHERGESSFGSGVLRDVLLPEDDDEHDDGEVGDDARFPAFDDDAKRSPRPSSDDEADIGPDDLS